MRSINQQDLIYKRCQAVTKASVNIIFSKNGYAADCHSERVEILPERSKSSARPNRNAVPIRSTQLNNPNFLIMQGRSRGKHSRFVVLVVSATFRYEVLGLVEEAAATRMFEERTDKAKKTMSKKEIRVQEITSILEEQTSGREKVIPPIPEDMRSHRAPSSRCSRLGVEKRDHAKEKQQEVKEVPDVKARFARKVQAAEKVKKRDAEIKKGGKLKFLEENVAELARVLIKVKTEVDLKQNKIFLGFKMK
ncbi:hypothetical protein M378DRAFT_27043 [Amanita muscaria Koide BX008]|uniref:Uncharacterized protein n=1 Tax=Amanita muscaria (strain Koide BX008) TaxID=946122 RepID=A0A0C2WDB0_AMAMK|nr:hypothetical protein M378DRAFT_27043 [Amanita muscaria Koide BX008]